MTVKHRLYKLLAVAAVMVSLFALAACKNKKDTLSTDTDTTTATPDEVISTTATTENTTEATTVATTTTTTTKTTKAPTTKAPDKVKVTAKPTTKAPVTQAPTVKTQLDAMGRSEKVMTPEEFCKMRNITMEQYQAGLKRTAEYKCEYCGKHDCASIVYLKDTNGNAYNWSINKWKCPTYAAEDHICSRCGRKLCSSTDPNAKRDDYCTGGCGFTIE